MPEIRLPILPTPHSEGQRELIFYPGNVVAFCGRRYGKTYAGAERIIINAIRDPGLYWWVGLTWQSASMRRAWRMLKVFVHQMWRGIGQSADGKIRESDKILILPNGSEVWMRTADNEMSLAGEGIKGVVLDEFSLMNSRVWPEYVQATLLDHNGWAMFIGVPKGKNWATDLWYQAADRPGWIQRRYTTYDNPKMDKDKVNEIMLHSSENLFQQEYLAQIVDDAGSVFRNIRSCLAYAETEPEFGNDYVAGIDWAQLNDWTVIYIMNSLSKQVVDWDRFNQIDWAMQRGRLKALCDKWGVSSILAESNSIGQPNIEALQESGMPVVGFETTNDSKTNIIRALALAFEQRTIGIPDDPILLAELESFEATRLPSGRWRYNAPEGMHDDCVIALALAYWHCEDSTTGVGYITDGPGYHVGYNQGGY